MTDSDGREALDAKHERNQRDRIVAIKCGVAHIEEIPPEQWGPEQNAVVNSQVAAARAAGLDADHRQRVARELDDLDG